jgi:hypothetical protein
MNSPFSVHNELRIVRVANGFAVELPRPVKTSYPAGLEINPMVEGMRQSMPFFKELMRIRDADPLLESLQNPEPVEEPAPTKPEAVEKLGKDEYTFVFSTWIDVVDFLAQLPL